MGETSPRLANHSRLLVAAALTKQGSRRLNLHHIIAIPCAAGLYSRGAGCKCNMMRACLVHEGHASAALALSVVHLCFTPCFGEARHYPLRRQTGFSSSTCSVLLAQPLRQIKCTAPLKYCLPLLAPSSAAIHGACLVPSSAACPWDRLARRRMLDGGAFATPVHFRHFRRHAMLHA